VVEARRVKRFLEVGISLMGRQRLGGLSSSNILSNTHGVLLLCHYIGDGRVLIEKMGST
jgi:hypothetical protein